jgi:ABC-type uncharacterized transport system ATPase subunit
MALADIDGAQASGALLAMSGTCKAFGLVSQDLSLVPQLDVAQKVFLGQAPAAGLVPRARHRVATAAILARLAPQSAVDTPVSALGRADRQLVGIARTLARGGRVIAFDEPTSSLTPTGRDGRVVASGAMASRTDAELNSLIPGRGGRHNLAVLRHAVENLAI